MDDALSEWRTFSLPPSQRSLLADFRSSCPKSCLPTPIPLLTTYASAIAEWTWVNYMLGPGSPCRAQVRGRRQSSKAAFGSSRATPTSASSPSPRATCPQALSYLYKAASWTAPGPTTASTGQAGGIRLAAEARTSMVTRLLVEYGIAEKRRRQSEANRNGIAYHAGLTARHCVRCKCG